jgi:hypothetical protein
VNLRKDHYRINLNRHVAGSPCRGACARLVSSLLFSPTVHVLWISGFGGAFDEFSFESVLLLLFSGEAGFAFLHLPQDPCHFSQPIECV